MEEKVKETLLILHTTCTLIQEHKIGLDHKASYLYLLGILDLFKDRI